jgi:meso-butanediol dehydrogenase / (S,S)-butanediol dehydrogenase / diacetyl reductase
MKEGDGMRLSGKVAIVTGATKGVGRGIARRFAEEGAKVVVAGRSADAGRAVEREIRSAGGQAVFVRTDVSIEADCQGVVEAAEKEFGPLTTLVNNAAATHLIGSASPFADNRMHLLKNETLDEMWRSDLYGLFWCCRYALRAMLKHNAGGSIINISSGVAFGGGGDMDTYAASKGAMQAVTRSMAGEYADSSIRVNAIVLGLINNGGPVAEMLKDPQLTAGLLAAIPLPMIGEPDDIAWGAVYLASDESRYVTGSSLPIDGGATNTKRNAELSGTGWAAPRS